MTDTRITHEKAQMAVSTGIAVSLLAHGSWGMYPVLARYLQTVSDLPTFSILAFGNIIPLVILSRYLFHHVDLSVFRQRIVWIFAAIVVFRAITNIASTRFTLSIYVQLITQATPFIVILISTIIFREQLPRFTIPAVTAALIGSVMMVGPNFGNIPDDPTRRDWLGIGLAMMSVVSLGTYMVLVRRSMRSDVSSETLLIVQLIGIIIVGTGASVLIGEDWTSYTRLGVTDWIVFLVFAFLVFIGANLWQIQAIRQLGASFHSSLLATRLISSILFGWLLLGEQLQSFWQIAGAVVVAVTITWFLWQQR